MNKFINAFIEKKFGSSKLINKLSRFLIENKKKKEALYLNKLVKVVGSKSEKKIIDAFFKHYPKIEHDFSLNLKQVNNKFTIVNDNEKFQKIVLIITIFFLILFLVYSS